MKKLPIILLFFLPVLSNGQQKEWKIKGALAALEDTSVEIVHRAFGKLYELEVLDSLVYYKKIPANRLPYCKILLADFINDDLLIYALSCQKPIPENDLDFIKTVMIDRGPYNRVNELIGMLNGNRFFQPTFIDMYRSIWDSVDLETRIEIVQTVFGQKKIAPNDMQWLDRILSSSFENFKMEFVPAFDADNNIETKTMVSAKEGFLVAFINEHPAERISFLRILIAKGDSNLNTSIYNVLTVSPQLDNSLLNIYRELAARLNLLNDESYLRTLMDSPYITEAEIRHILEWIKNKNCDDQRWMISDLLGNEKTKAYASELITESFHKKNCGGELFESLSMSYNETLTKNPLIINEVKRQVAGNVKKFPVLMRVIADQNTLTKDDIQLISKTLETGNDDEKLSMLYEIRSSNSNPEILKIIRKYLHSKNENIRKTAIDILLQQEKYISEDIEYFRHGLQNYDDYTKQEILQGLAKQEILQPKILDLIISCIDTSRELMKDINVTLLDRLSIPDVLLKKSLDYQRTQDHADIYTWDTEFPMPVKHSMELVNWYFDADKRDKTKAKFFAYYNGGGSHFINFVLKWVGEPGEYIDNYIRKMSFQEKRQMLKVIDSNWADLKGNDKISDDVAGFVFKVIHSLNSTELRKLSGIASAFSKRFKGAPSLRKYAGDIEKKVNEVNGRWDKIVGFISKNWYFTLVHPFFWLLLIFVYPKSARVQSTFFWNENVRKWAGLGYVTLLLIHIPFLRNRLLSPFYNSLIADARLNDFKPENYFLDFPLIDEKSKNEINIHLLVTLGGKVIIRGESGLGKTMILRYLLSVTKKTSVFITAEQCKNDVVAAIASKMSGIAQDDKFIRSILYNGSIDVYIDGINEAGPETRVTISNFITQFRNCRCFITTQPINWDHPANASVIEVLALKKEKIASFLYSRYNTYTSQELTGKDSFVALCNNFLEKNLGDHIREEQRQLNQKILSNPLDLTIVGQLLINSPDKPLNLLSLQKEYYDQMAAYYSNTNTHKTEGFPLINFSERIYELRLKDEPLLPYGEFHEEIDCMHRFKMVVNRISENGNEEMFFRHDKIKEYFLLQAFLSHKERQQEHLDDPRFRGVYFLLATFLSLEDAKSLERLLINYSVDNNDHMVSSEFIKILRNRTSAENRA